MGMFDSLGGIQSTISSGGLSGITDIFNPAPHAGDVGAAAGGASGNAAFQSDMGRKLWEMFQANQGRQQPIQDQSTNTFLAMMRGEDPMGNVSGGIGGVNRNFTDANEQIRQNLAGGGRDNPNYAQHLLANNALARADAVSGLQAQGKQAGLHGLLEMLRGSRQESSGLLGGTNQSFGGSTSGYGTAGGLYGQQSEMDQYGLNNALKLGGLGIKGTAMAAGMPTVPGAV